ncbi:unnamed protein product [Rotaria socialis]
MDSQNYQSLTDPHLNSYFNNKRIRRHLIKAGLINRHGDILPPVTYEVALVKRAKRKQSREKLSNAVANYVLEEEHRRQAFLRNHFDLAIKRARVQKIRESLHHQPRVMFNSLVQISRPVANRRARTPSPIGHKRSLARAKSAGQPAINLKPQSPHRSPKTKHATKDMPCEVTMIYYGPQTVIDSRTNWCQPHGDEIMVMQQHCGGENLVVFKGFKYLEIFTFESRRHRDYPFAVAIYINGLIDSRISVCCEYKHKHHVRLGSKHGLFAIYDIKKSEPCRTCRLERRLKGALTVSPTAVNASAYRKSVVPLTQSANELHSDDLPRAPSPSTDSGKNSPKGKTERCCLKTEPNVVPKRLSSASLPNKNKNDEFHRKESVSSHSTATMEYKPSTPDQQPIKGKKDDSRKSSRVSSSTSRKSVVDSPVNLTKTEYTRSPLSGEKSNLSLKPSPRIKTTNVEPTLPAKKPYSSQSSSSEDENDNNSFYNTTSEQKLIKKPISRSSMRSSTPDEKRINKNKDLLLNTSSESEHSEEVHVKQERIEENDDTISPINSPRIDSFQNNTAEKKPIGKTNDLSLNSSSESEHSEEVHVKQEHIDESDNTTSPINSPRIDSFQNNTAEEKPIGKTNDLSSNSSSESEFFEEPTDEKNYIEKNDSTISSNDSSMNDFFATANAKEEPTAKNIARSSSRSVTSNSTRKSSPTQQPAEENIEMVSSRISSATKSINLPVLTDNHTGEELDSSSLSSTINEKDHQTQEDEFHFRHSSTSAGVSPKPYGNTAQHLENKSSSSDDDSESIPDPRGRNADKYPLEIETAKTSVRPYLPMENIVVVWVDATTDNIDNDTLNSKVQLRQVARTIRTFTDSEKCVKWIEEIKDGNIFLISSGKLGEAIMKEIESYSQIALIYIYCQQKSNYEYLGDKYKKVKGIYTDLSTICEHLKADAKQWENDLNTFQTAPLNFMQELSPEQLLFIKNQLFKEYLLEVPYDKDAVSDLVDYCESLYSENPKELELLKELKEEYRADNALYWYTKDCFLYHMLNKAIRTKDITILCQMGFFIHDINQQLEKIYAITKARSSVDVFRGQGMKLEYFEELKQSQGGLISFNGFLSTSTKYDVAYEFAQRSLSNGFPIAVLFRMKIDSTNSSYPFASLENHSFDPSEYEILFSFKAIFHIEAIEEIEKNFWKVDIALINQNESDLSRYIEIESNKFNDFVGYEKLGELLIQMNELDRARDLYEMNIPLNSDSKYIYVYNQLGSICLSLKNYKSALLYYNLALQTKSSESLNDYVTISNIHNKIGKILYEQEKFDEALEKFQNALSIQLEHLSSTHPSLVNTYDLLGMYYQQDDKYERALEYHQKKLKIQEKASQSNQADIASTHFNIGICLENLNRFTEAMDYVQKSVDSTHFNDAELHDRQKALERIRKELE